MKIKHITLITIGILISFFSFSQDQVKLLINKRVVGQVNVGSEVHVAKAQGKKYGVIHSLMLEIDSATFDRKANKRNLVIAGENGHTLFSVEENPRKWHPGIYEISIEKARKALAEHKLLKIYYSFTPFKKNLAPNKVLLLTVNVD